MKTFPYVEDYLEVINGDRDPVTGKLLGLFNTTPPIIQLARYDVKVLDSMSQSTQCSKPLTDKQAELACKIILKYRKQLAAKSIDVSPVEYPKFRMQLREIDRSCSLTMGSNEIILKFPYNVKLIDSMRELSKLSQGRWQFDGNTKVWRIGLTEPNVIAAHGFAKNNEFEIDSQVTDLANKIVAKESENFKIQLVERNGTFEIENAPPSLQHYVDSNLGNDLVKLIDNSSVLHYEIQDSIVEAFVRKFSPRIYNLLVSSEIKFAPTSMSSDLFEEIIDYCNLTDRYPIYIYEPDMSDKLYNNFVVKHFKTEQIYRVKNTKDVDIPIGARIVFFNKYNASWTKEIPLLISSAGMMHGGEKTMLLQRAKKVVYFATEVYNVRKIKNS